MKILKPGKVEQRKFVCPDCECEFVVGDYEENVYWDEDDCVVRCPVCRENLLWCDGEPYEEPMRDTQTDRERLYGILLTVNPIATTSELTNSLIANGVTFRED